MEIKEITTEELVKKLERKDRFKLIMTFHEEAFKAKHRPGSINVFSEESAAGLIHPDDEIVVYCVNKNCIASLNAYHLLASRGFQNLRRYTGGLEAWEAAGLALEGNNVSRRIDIDDSFLSK